MKGFVALPSVGSRERLSVGEREIRWRGGSEEALGRGGEGCTVIAVEDRVEELED